MLGLHPLSTPIYLLTPWYGINDMALSPLRYVISTLVLHLLYINADVVSYFSFFQRWGHLPPNALSLSSLKSAGRPFLSPTGAVSQFSCLCLFIFNSFSLFSLVVFILLTLLPCISWCLFPLHGRSSILFFMTDVLTSKFEGVRFALSFPFLPVIYLYSHIGDNVSFKFVGKDCPFVFFLFMLCFDSK